MNNIPDLATVPPFQPQPTEWPVSETDQEMNEQQQQQTPIDLITHSHPPPHASSTTMPYSYHGQPTYNSGDQVYDPSDYASTQPLMQQSASFNSSHPSHHGPLRTFISPPPDDSMSVISELAHFGAPPPSPGASSVISNQAQAAAVGGDKYGYAATQQSCVDSSATTVLIQPIQSMSQLTSFNASAPQPPLNHPLTQTRSPIGFGAQPPMIAQSESLHVPQSTRLKPHTGPIHSMTPGQRKVTATPAASSAFKPPTTMPITAASVEMDVTPTAVDHSTASVTQPEMASALESPNHGVSVPPPDSPRVSRSQPLILPNRSKHRTTIQPLALSLTPGQPRVTVEPTLSASKPPSTMPITFSSMEIDIAPIATTEMTQTEMNSADRPPLVPDSPSVARSQSFILPPSRIQQGTPIHPLGVSLGPLTVGDSSSRTPIPMSPSLVAAAAILTSQPTAQSHSMDHEMTPPRTTLSPLPTFKLRGRPIQKMSKLDSRLSPPEMVSSIPLRLWLKEWQDWMETEPPADDEGKFTAPLFELRTQVLDQLSEYDRQLEELIDEAVAERFIQLTKQAEESNQPPPAEIPTLSNEEIERIMCQNLPKMISLVVHTKMSFLEFYNTALFTQVCHYRHIPTNAELTSRNFMGEEVEPLNEHLHPSSDAVSAFIRNVEGPTLTKPIGPIPRPPTNQPPIYPITTPYQDSFYLAVREVLRRDTELATQVETDCVHGKLLMYYYLKQGRTRTRLRIIPDEESANAPIDPAHQMHEFISFRGIVQEIGPVEQLSFPGGYYMTPDEAADSHAPEMSVPIQSLTVTTISRKEADSKVTSTTIPFDHTQLTVDIDGELVGSFAAGDEIVGSGHLRRSHTRRQQVEHRRRGHGDRTDSEETEEHMFSDQAQPLLVQANHVLLTSAWPAASWISDRCREFRMLFQDICSQCQIPQKHECHGNDWAITEMMMEFFALDIVPGKMYPLTKLHLLLSLASGGTIHLQPPTSEEEKIDPSSLASPIPFRSPISPVGGVGSQSSSSAGVPSSIPFRPLNVLILSEGEPRESIRKLVKFAAPYSHLQAHHITGTRNFLDSNERLGDLRRNSDEATLITIRSEFPLRPNEADRLMKVLFPPPAPVQPSTVTQPSSRSGLGGRRGGRGGGRGGRGGRRRSAIMNQSSEFISLTLHKEIRPDRIKADQRQTWFHTQLGLPALVKGRGGNPYGELLIPCSDGDRALFAHFDLISLLNKTAFDSLVEREKTPEVMSYFTLNSLHISRQRPSNYYDGVTSFGTELKLKPLVKQLLRCLNTPTILKEYFTAIQAIPCNQLTPEATTLLNNFKVFVLSSSNDPGKAYTHVWIDVIHRIAFAHARLHFRAVADTVDVCVGIMLAEESISIRFGSQVSALKWSRTSMPLDGLNIEKYRPKSKSKENPNQTLTRPQQTAVLFESFYKDLISKINQSTKGSSSQKPIIGPDQYRRTPALSSTQRTPSLSGSTGTISQPPSSTGPTQSSTMISSQCTPTKPTATGARTTTAAPKQYSHRVFQMPPTPVASSAPVPTTPGISTFAPTTPGQSYAPFGKLSTPDWYRKPHHDDEDDMDVQDC